jgi:hypothetical protein
VAVVHYTDGDYRCKWFTPTYFTDNEDEWWEVDAERVKREYVPTFNYDLGRMREEPGEPQHLLYEVYWNSELVWELFLASYDPVALPSEEEVQQ